MWDYIFRWVPFATCDARKNRSCVVRLSYNRRTFTRIAAVVHAPCEICKLIETDVLHWTYASKSICVPDFFVKREACVYTELKVSVHLRLHRKEKYVSTRTWWHRRPWCYDCCPSKQIKQNGRRVRQLWVKQWIQRRRYFGQYQTLFTKLEWEFHEDFMASSG